jgi:glycosyltransferase involved in cell wall biosynthesis
MMPIPPKGWGAVEILIDDYRKNLIKLGHQVDIVNTRNPNAIVQLVNSLNPDFVHIQYDEFIVVAEHLKCKNVAVTSHYGYLEQPEKWDPGYRNIFWQFVNSKVSIFALSPGISNVYKRAGIDPSRLHVIPNGVRTDLFNFSERCKRPDESIYLAKIEPRKMQTKFQTVQGIKFVGNCVDPNFDVKNPSYLGEWTKSDLYQNLTEFSNLVLLSDGEAHPLVCMEALSAGLGLVISEYAAANLDTSLPFIDVISKNDMSNVELVKNVIEKNRNISAGMRSEIREYAKKFDWEKTCQNYCKVVSSIVS